MSWRLCVKHDGELTLWTGRTRRLQRSWHRSTALTHLKRIQTMVKLTEGPRTNLTYGQQSSNKANAESGHWLPQGWKTWADGKPWVEQRQESIRPGTIHTQKPDNVRFPYRRMKMYDSLCRKHDSQHAYENVQLSVNQSSARRTSSLCRWNSTHFAWGPNAPEHYTICNMTRTFRLHDRIKKFEVLNLSLAVLHFLQLTRRWNWPRITCLEWPKRSAYMSSGKPL